MKIAHWSLVYFLITSEPIELSTDEDITNGDQHCLRVIPQTGIVIFIYCD